MEIADMRGRLEAIRAAFLARDHEKAHALEDALHVSALQAIAAGTMTHSQCVVMASLALSTRELPIERYAA
jgi:hypothetical protein